MSPALGVGGDGVNAIFAEDGDDYLIFDGILDYAWSGTGHDKLAFSVDDYDGKASINDFDLWDDTLVFNGWAGNVDIGQTAGGDVQFTFANGGSVILTNVDYQQGMSLDSFNIEWN